jgi:rare lipoprotein A
MGKFILGATFVLSLIGSVTTASAHSNTSTSVSVRELKQHHHLNIRKVLNGLNPVRYLRGIASWYGEQFQGSLTASGAIFNTNRFMCAMRYIPFRTWVVVTNLSNGVSARCQIMDRGPFVPGRIIDLSHAVKVALGINGGTAPVSITY